MDENEEKIQNKKKREFVVKEIISTERTYLSRLQITLEVYAKPLKANRVLDNNDISTQFDVLEKLYELHNKYAVTDELSDTLNFVELLNDISNNFEIYSQYLVNYEPAMQRRGSLLTSNRKYSDFLDRAMKDPKCLNQNIESLLIMPVQRIPRYRLLLEQLLKYTPEDHEDYVVVRTALDKICDVAMFNNEAIRKRENKTKMMAIMMQFEPRSRIDLLDDSNRQFIKDGTLLRQCRRGLKEFHFWLFTDKLLYGQGLPLGDIFILNRDISLSKCFVKLFDSIYDNERTFMVESPAKSFIIRAKNEQERNEWLKAIKDAIQKQQERISQKRGSVAPLWIPDAISSQCQRCNNKFTIINRRHHCRNCGVIVCDTCSNKRFLVRHVDQNKEVRVCDQCHTSLSRSDSAEKGSGEEVQVLDYYNSDEEDVDAGVVALEDAEETHRGTVNEEQLNDFNEEYTALGEKLKARDSEEVVARHIPAPAGGRGGGRGPFAFTKSASHNSNSAAFSPTGSPSNSSASTSGKTVPNKRPSMFGGAAMSLLDMTKKLTRSTFVGQSSPQSPSLQSFSDKTQPETNSPRRDASSPVPCVPSRDTPSPVPFAASGAENEEDSSSPVVRRVNPITLSLRRNPLFNAANNADSVSAATGTDNSSAPICAPPPSDFTPPSKPPKPTNSGGSRVARRTNVFLRPEDMPKEQADEI